MVFSDSICANLGDKLSKIFPPSKTTTYAKRSTILWEWSVFVLEFNVIFLCADKINTFGRRRIDLIFTKRRRIFIKSEIEMLTSELFQISLQNWSSIFVSSSFWFQTLQIRKTQMITHVKLEWLLFETFFFLIEDELICVE